ncbi:MAG: OmpA family protein [bacterium]|nr:OmpA family protein [bacterium]
MTKRNTILAVTAAILLAVAAFFVWRHIAGLGEQLGDLNRQVEDLHGQVAGAEDRAEQAEARAEEARTQAGAAADRAEQAATREMQTAEQARLAEQDRKMAEKREQAAAAARLEAEEEARRAAAARAAAEEEQVAAEIKRDQALIDAELAREREAAAKAEAGEIRKKLEVELDRLQGALGKIADTRRTALGLVMTLDSDQIEFDFDKANLRPRNRELLSRIAGVLLTFQDYGLQVFGHTDDVGTVEYNQKLSERRADAVRDYLVVAGIDQAVMSTRGLGKSSPVVQGTDPASRQRNRRVELAIVFSEGDVEAVVDEEGSGPP